MPLKHHISKSHKCDNSFGEILCFKDLATRLFATILFLLFAVSLNSQSLAKAWEPVQKRIDNGESFTNEELLSFMKKYQKELDKNYVEKSIIYDFLGSNAFKEERYQDAVDLFNTAIDITKQNNDTIYRAFYVYDLACLYNHIGYYPVAEPLFRQSLPTLAAVYGQSSLQYTMRFKILAEMYVEMGNYTYAKSMNDALLYYFKTLYGESHREYLICLNNDARIDQGTGNYQKAISTFHKLLNAHSANSTIDTTDYITTLNNTAEAYRVAGNYSEALNYLNKANDLSQRFPRVDLLTKATIYNNAGLCYKASGQYKEAETSYDNAITIYKKLKLDYSPDYTNALNNKAELFRNLGRYKAAIDYLSEVITLREQSLGTRHVNYANALVNVALVYIDEYAYRDAEPFLLKAKEIYAEVLGESHQYYANCLNSLSSVYLGLNKFKEAEEYKLKAIEIIKKAVGENHERYAYYLGGTVRIYDQQKKYDKAIQSVLIANEIFKKNFGEKHIAYIDGLFNLGYFYFKSNDYKKAKDYYLSSLRGYKEQFDKFFDGMSENEQFGYYSVLEDRFQTFNTFVARYAEKFPKENNSELVKLCFDYQLFIKSLLLNRNLSARQQILASKDTSLLRTYNDWLTSKQKLSESFRNLDVESNYENVASLEQRITKLEQELKSKTALFKSSKENHFLDIQKALKPKEAAVSIFTSVKTLDDTTGISEYWAMIVKPGLSSPILMKLKDSDQFDELYFDHYSTNIEEKKTDLFSYDRFWKQISMQLTGIGKIYITPDGVYNKLNLYTLYNPLTNKYVLDDLTVVSLPNLSVILNERKSNENKTADLFGFPDYEFDFSKKTSQAKLGAPVAVNRFGFSELTPLPGTKTEIENISRSLGDSKWKINSFTKENASETQLKKVQSPKVLHIATHGFFLKYVEESEDKSILGFEANALKHNPFLRSGIMMAGASVVARDTLNINSFDQDGIFTAYEASLLNLNNTDLVVLSACETGLGVSRNNQGVFGLQYAFYMAGARNLIMSLWVVDDEATQILMSEFYKAWGSDPSSDNISAAFKKAQGEVRKKYPQPYYWGAFQLLGH
jgi:CHAT domain-containing protein